MRCFKDEQTFSSGILRLSLPVGCFLACSLGYEPSFTEKHVSQLSRCWISMCLQSAVRRDINVYLVPQQDISLTNFCSMHLFYASFFFNFFNVFGPGQLQLLLVNIRSFNRRKRLGRCSCANIGSMVKVADLEKQPTDTETSGEKNMDIYTSLPHTLKSSSRGSILLSTLATMHPGSDK